MKDTVRAFQNLPHFTVWLLFSCTHNTGSTRREQDICHRYKVYLLIDIRMHETGILSAYTMPPTQTHAHATHTSTRIHNRPNSSCSLLSVIQHCSIFGRRWVILNGKNDHLPQYTHILITRRPIHTKWVII